MPITPYAGLDAVLTELAGHAAEVLGDGLVGAYVEGSFALDAGDEHSDVDFMVATRSALTDAQVSRLRAFHDELPTRAEHWAQHVEGSYAPLSDLQDATATGRRWLFVNHGHREMTWDTHGNDHVHRWVLREHGIVLRGRPTADVVAPVTAEALRDEAWRELAAMPGSLLDWLPLDVAWSQRYLVVTYCRVLFTLTRAAVTSKAGALGWAAEVVDPRWRPLLAQVGDDRALGWDADQPPEPAALEAALAFGQYAQQWAATQRLSH